MTEKRIRTREYRNRYRQEHLEQCRSYQRKYERQTRAWVWEYLSAHPCVDCGESDSIVLEFDHLPELGRGVRGGGHSPIGCHSIKAASREIAKCEVVCANCHSRRTHARGQRQRAEVA